MSSDAPRRIQRKRTKGWRMPVGAVCVDRSTPFGNPFPVTSTMWTSAGATKRMWVVGTWAGPGMWFLDTKEEAAALSVRVFRTWVMLPQQAKLRCQAARALRGKDLACWCAGGQPCHADILLELANAEPPRG